MADHELLQQALAALEAANCAIEAGMCFHENTHRGGAIWTICDDCGSKWADDRGGFQKPTMPKAYGQALQAIAALRRALGVTEPVTGWCNKCGARPTTSHHKRPDGSDCPYLATGDIPLGVTACLTCAANHYCPTHNPAPAGVGIPQNDQPKDNA